MADKGSPPARRKVALALQGGGSHGAFTWGVLDRLLEEATIEVIGVTGTSAGAMNAVALADGLVRGGAKQARQGLRKFWTAIGDMNALASYFWPMSGETVAQLRLEKTLAYTAWDMVSRNLSPYDLNPSKLNPLRGPLTDLIDFDGLRAQEAVQVMVCATNCLTARRRVFTNKDISVDAVLASACLPQLFPAVEIDGQPYWDGGYTGNPAIAPLLRKMPKCDLIIVRVDPINRKETPRSVTEIHDRVTEIAFNSTFWLELSALGAILKLVDDGHLDRARFGRIFFHAIEASDVMEKLAHSSKLNSYQTFLEYLFDLGRQTADAWFASHGPAIGQKSTVDLQKLLPVET